jgi:hypothetical protein
VQIFSTLDAILKQIRTPLSLAGLTIIVLYLLYSQILKMDIFAPLKLDATYQLLDKILGYLFWLALVSVILGAIGYLSHLLTTRRQR